jgi:hypothetical protein
MKRIVVQRAVRRDNTARNAWIVFGGLVALGVIAITIRELPSMRREARLMRM